MSIGLLAVLATAAAAPAAWAGAGDAGQAQGPRKLEWTTTSQEARDGLTELQRRIESFQGGRPTAELAKKVAAADPEFALGAYYVSATTPPPENRKLLAQAVELARKKASDGERRFIETMAIVRGDKPADGIEPLRALARDYPGERIVHVLLGQLLADQKQLEEARAEYEKANALDASTPRVHSLLAALALLKGDYARARASYESALKAVPAGVAPFQLRNGIAYTYLYEGKVDEALASLQAFVEDYKKAGSPFGIPEVFVWNAIGRVNLENGRAAEALKAYEKGYESVPGSGLDETEKKIWLGRLHHGRGRALARLGRHEEAWKEAATLRKMIDEGGERGKEFEPAYHYLAGYLKLEAGDTKAALEHLQQTDKDNPFHRLLLARAYERNGDKQNARKTYEEVVASTQNNLERALAYPEAKRRLAAL